MQDKRDMTIKELAKDCRTIEDVHAMLKICSATPFSSCLKQKWMLIWAMPNIILTAITREIVGMGIAKRR
ncbi:hypothetical protein D478_27092 [Brevibacillus agri BAB-2500]|nr:hypothetical protein D478_27092 [Brevibacillus agri BAB-2500]